MVLFAGPIVIEWYSLPIALVMLFGPPLAVSALISELILRTPRWGPPTWPKRRRLWGVGMGVWILLTAISQAVVATASDDRDVRVSEIELTRSDR